MTRRHFLSTTALAGAGAALVLLGARSAWAFTPAAANADVERLYRESCSIKDGAYHRQLVADVRERLKGRATDAEIEAAIARATCPICGCPIATI